MFTENNSPDRDVELYVSTSEPGGAFVTVTSPGWTNPRVDERIAVSPGQQTRVVVSRNLIAVGTEISTKGIKISSSAVVSVTAFNRQNSNCDGFLVYPTEALGTAYFAVTSPFNAQIGVVSPRDGTMVEITFPNVPTVSVTIERTQYGPGSTFRTTLNQHETLQIQDSSGSDLTGTLIRASQPIAVFSGNSYTFIGGNNVLDHTVEQMPPVSAWGTDYIVFPTPSTEQGGVIKIVAAEANTDVQVFTSTVLQRTLRTPGDSVEVDFRKDEFCRVLAQKPVLVVHLAKSGGNFPSEPAMAVIPPRAQYLPSYNPNVPPTESGLFDHYFFLISNFNQISSLLLDNAPMDSRSWIPLASETDGTAVRTLTVQPGYHNVRSTGNFPIGLYQYGYVDTGCAYLYSAGQCLDTINSVVSKMLFLSSFFRGC